MVTRIKELNSSLRSYKLYYQRSRSENTHSWGCRFVSGNYMPAAIKSPTTYSEATSKPGGGKQIKSISQRQVKQHLPIEPNPPKRYNMLTRCKGGKMELINSALGDYGKKCDPNIFGFACQVSTSIRDSRD